MKRSSDTIHPVLRCMTEWSGVIAVFLALVVPLIIVFLRGDFDVRSRYISELGAHDEPYEMIIRWISFFPAGLFFLFFTLTVIRPLAVVSRTPVAWILIGFWGVGWTASALFPCDPGCPFTGSFSQMIHGFAILPPYVFGVPFGLIRLHRHFDAQAFSKGFLIYGILAAIVFLSSYLIILPGFFADYRGAIQWLGELSFAGWIIWLSVIRFRCDRIYAEQAIAPNL